ncbi:MAG: hypothetical protein ACE5NA_03535 [Nitrospiraceae bacterium]
MVEGERSRASSPASGRTVNPNELISSLHALSPDTEEEIIRDVIVRMDPEYLDRFPPQEIAHHLQLVTRLTSEDPCQVSITERGDGVLEIIVVAYDYFSEFAAISGLLSAFGLDIREGCVYTSSDAMAEPSTSSRSSSGSPSQRRRRAALTRKMIIDVFLVYPAQDASFTTEQRNQFVEELKHTVQLLDSDRYQEVRNHVNRRLVESLGKSRSTFTGLLDPVQVRFTNDESSEHTILDIRSTDTPAFLYAFSNALAMRGIYIHKARFEQVAGQVHDRFYIRDRRGRKIERRESQQELQLTATLIKQFTQCLTWAPDPAKAIEYFDQFLDRLLEGAKRGRTLMFLREKGALSLLARLLGTSDYLWEDFLRRQHGNLLPILHTYQQLPLIRPRVALAKELRKHVSQSRSEERRKRMLNDFKDREMFRIDMKHLMDSRSALPDFSAALTVLAEVVIDQTVHECQAVLSRAHGVPKLTNGKPCPFAVLGMGKFGGRELGYASDIEVLFVYGGEGKTGGRHTLENREYYERLVQAVMQWIEAKQEGIFHLDVRLRPHGGKGLLANNLAELRTYYSSSGLSAPFERQALIKLRWVAGDQRLGKQVEAHRDAYVYSGEPWDLPTALELRERQVHELVAPGHTNVKYSPGGLIDVEYATQYLQLRHGHTDARLRTPNTLQGLAALRQAGLLSSDEATTLTGAYLFLRRLIDALRIVRGHAKDLVLPAPDSEEFVFLARRLGYTTQDWRKGAAELWADIQTNMAKTREIFLARFGSC